MKQLGYLLITITIFASSGCYCQKNRGYKKALDYIIKMHPDEHIVISDTIARLSFVFFTDELDSFWNKKNANATYDLLDSVDHSNDSVKTRVTILTNKRFPGQEPEKIVYFSPFYNNMVIGEILERRFKGVGLKHTAQAAFNSSIEYLFIFDKHYKLKKVFTAKIQYD